MGLVAFQQITVTDVDDVLNTLDTFCAANGWTTNNNSVFGNGRRLHMQKTGSETVHSDLFVNLRSSDPKENHFNDSANVFHLGLNMSEVFTLADDPMRQGESGTPRYPRDAVGAGQSRGAGISFASPDPNFPANQTAFMWIFDLPDLVIVYLEYSPGRFNFFYFGEMKKTATFTGGQVFGASYGYESITINGSAENQPRFMDFTNDHPNNFIRVDFDTTIGRWVQNHTSGSGFTALQGLIGRHLNQFFIDATPNVFNGKAPLIISYIYVRRAGGIQQSHLGFFEHVRHINMQNLSAKQQFSVGSSDWQVFPFRAKGAIEAGIGDDTLSANRAVAIRRN